MWKRIVGYNNYEVNEMGEVRNWHRDTMLTPSKTQKGYWVVELWEKGKRSKKLVHRLVAEAFIPNPEGKPLVNHIDADKGNCKLENLEWVTAYENMVHARNLGLYNWKNKKK
jgi:hypothetical protein